MVSGGCSFTPLVFCAVDRPRAMESKDIGRCWLFYYDCGELVYSRTEEIINAYIIAIAETEVD